MSTASPRASKRGGRQRRLPPGPTLAAILTAALLAACLWPARCKGRTAREAVLLSQNEAAQATGSRQVRTAPGGLAAASATALFDQKEPPTAVRSAALIRMAARLQDGKAALSAGSGQQREASSQAQLQPDPLATAGLPAVVDAAAAGVGAAAAAQQSTSLDTTGFGSNTTDQQEPSSSSSSGSDNSSSSRSSSSSSPAASSTPQTVPAAAQHVAGAAGGAGTSCQPNLVVTLTSHKTGTAQAGCIVEMTEQRYVMKGGTRHDAHPPNLHAVAAFAHQRLQTQFSGGASSGHLYCPSVKFYSSGHHLPRLEDESCPGTLPCPCIGEQEQCLSTEAGSIDIPRGNTTVVQVIREPISVVLSAYQYHMQDPAPEEWLEQMRMENFTGWLYTGGVPYHVLDSLGAFAAAAASDSYHSFLRRLPAEQGVKLQFWMSAWELYGFARQYASLTAQAAQPGLRFLPIRFEDLQDRFNATARQMLEAFRERVPALNVSALLQEVQACHISTWESGLLASHDHVTSHRDPALRVRLRAVLLADPDIAPRICELDRMFGYAGRPSCQGSEGGGGRGGGAEQVAVGGGKAEG